MKVNGREVSIGDVVELQFVKGRGNTYFSRSDEGIVILIEKALPIWVQLEKTKPESFIIKAKITKILDKYGRIYALCRPVEQLPTG